MYFTTCNASIPSGQVTIRYVMNDITFESVDQLDPNEFIDILNQSTLGSRRPVEDLKRMEAMSKNANLIITARHNDQLIGVARSVTDGVYCTYLSDLAVHVSWQHRGIGKELIRQTKLSAPEATLILLSAPAATDYYPKIGMTQHQYAFMLNDIEDLH